jgi:Domain of unknown function (DUF4833)
MWEDHNMANKPNTMWIAGKEQPMHILCMTLLTLLLLPLLGWSTEVSLFAIQRNKNANEVEYRLRVDDRCQLVSTTPVHVVWKLLADHPEKTAPLTDLEHMAYGAVDQRIAGNWVAFDLGFLDHFRPLDQRRIKATALYDPQTATCVPIVHTAINGQAAALERIYVQADEGALKPKVLYIDVFGQSVAATPTPLQERITP